MIKNDKGIINLRMFDDERFSMLEIFPECKEMQLVLTRLLFKYAEYNGNMERIGSSPINSEVLSVLFKEKKEIVDKCLDVFESWGIVETKEIDGEKIVDFVNTDSFGVNVDDGFWGKSVTRNTDVTKYNKGKEKNKIKAPIKAEQNTVYKEIIDYFNEKLGTRYKSTTNKNKELIKARLNEGFTVGDFKTVIDNKILDWKGSDMEKYLRPVTLFGTKFDSYLNTKIIKRTQEGHIVDASEVIPF